MDAVELVKLHRLMEITNGDPTVAIGLIDGPVDMGHADLSHANFQELPGSIPPVCAGTSSIACRHGTSVVGILAARRGSDAPAVCPGCTLLLRPVFADNPHRPNQIPDTNLEELSNAIVECVDAGAQIINVSAAPVRTFASATANVEEALNYACRRGVLVVAAAGNQGTLGSSLITRHKWVVTVGACDNQGRPMGYSNLGASIALNGLNAPGSQIRTLSPGGKSSTFSGTSAAAPFVTGTVALLWSIFPRAQASDIRLALVSPLARGRKTVVPRLLNALGAYGVLNSKHIRRVS